jgi:colanic acid biosynthesis protein WcaH
MEDRLLKVANIEIGTEVEYDSSPLCCKEVFLPHDTRGHFVSFLYNCFLSSDFDPSNSMFGKTDAGFLQWHEVCPDNLVEVQNMYRPYIEGTYFA